MSKLNVLIGKVGAVEGGLQLLKGRVAPRFSPDKLEEIQRCMFLVYAKVNGISYLCSLHCV